MRRAMTGLAAVLGIVLIVLWFRQWVVVDSCYDQGGYWSKEEKRCIGNAGSETLFRQTAPLSRNWTDNSLWRAESTGYQTLVKAQPSGWAYLYQGSLVHSPRSKSESNADKSCEQIADGPCLERQFLDWRVECELLFWDWWGFRFRVAETRHPAQL